jgi:putative alpha-1,2-mannosidase
MRSFAFDRTTEILTSYRYSVTLRDYGIATEITPGVPAYQIGTPLFDDATILLDSGKLFRIRAEGASAGKLYIQSAPLNGVPFNRYAINHAEIVAGGDLVFKMSIHPNWNWPGK